MRTDGLGDAFTSNFDFTNSISTTPGNHSLSMYTIIDCALDGCEAAQDTISIQVKDGLSGTYTEVAKVTSNGKDKQWIKIETGNFKLTQNRAFVSVNLLFKNHN